MINFITSLLMPIYILLGIASPIAVGTSITTINGTDTLSSSRTTINDNFTALNNGKLEQSNYFATTSLPSTILASSLTSVGTITSGTWSGTAIAVAKGGTGTTSPTSNLVMLGNGSSGLKVVSGFGSSGQFLTSNGDASAPTWQTSAVALGDDYTWTGGHMWTASSTHLATTTIAASSVTNNALVLNGANTQWPSANSEGVLYNNGSGVYTIGRSCDGGYYVFSSSNVAATTTINHSLGGTPKYFSFQGNSDIGTNTISFSSGYGTTTNATWGNVGQSFISNSITGTTAYRNSGYGKVLWFSTADGTTDSAGIVLTALTSTTFDISNKKSANDRTMYINWTMCK